MSDEFELPPLVDCLAVCHTEGCENGGIPIPVSCAVAEPFVVCGPCGEQITEITPVEAS